jgi:hypothetical protein
MRHDQQSFRILNERADPRVGLGSTYDQGGVLDTLLGLADLYANH